MFTRKTVFLLLWVLTLTSTPAWSRVFIRWTYPDVPQAKILGLNDLVISWNDGALTLLESGYKQGYHVYLEATPQQASAAAEAGKNFAAGLLLKISPSEQTDVDASLQTLRSL